MGFIRSHKNSWPVWVVSSCIDEPTTSQHVIRVAWTDWITSSKSSMKMRWKNRWCANENSQNWHHHKFYSLVTLWHYRKCIKSYKKYILTHHKFCSLVTLWHYRKCIRSHKNFHFDTTINSILLWHCDTTGSALDHTKKFYFDTTINSILLWHCDTTGST